MRREAFGSDTLLCSPAMIHLSSARGAAGRFVKHCADFADASVAPLPSYPPKGQ